MVGRQTDHHNGRPMNDSAKRLRSIDTDDREREARRAPAVGRGRRGGFVWSRANILYAIDLWHREHLRSPSVTDWSRAGENHPAARTVFERFGSWNAAVTAAGLRARPRGGSLPNQPRGIVRQQSVTALPQPGGPTPESDRLTPRLAIDSRKLYGDPRDRL